jgi:hypothetical protein
MIREALQGIAGRLLKECREKIDEGAGVVYRLLHKISQISRPRCMGWVECGDRSRTPSCSMAISLSWKTCDGHEPF